MSTTDDPAPSKHEDIRSFPALDVPSFESTSVEPETWFVPRQRESSPEEAVPTLAPRPPIPTADRAATADAQLGPATCSRCDRRDRRVKRAVDISGALAGLIAGAPLLVLAAIAIQAEDGGPVLFRQERIGERGRPFTILKFRTMVADAENKGPGLVTYRGDPRITRVGRLLRATSLDELPQLLNILRGEMSLVGPRPTVRSQVERYTSSQLRRLSVPPGLAGWAQVNGRNSVPWSRRIELDVWYVDHRSIRLDLLIILRTIRTLVLGSGTYGAGGRNEDLDSAGVAHSAATSHDTESPTTSPRSLLVRPASYGPPVGG
ncbi:sugar transferase [Parafrankia sp. FMc6]|uniref:sugar transferase n=1 Tax=Parafrankia soli TaxID=2599596 RepID=UPI0034D3E025